MPASSIHSSKIIKVTGDSDEALYDALAIEEPLEIRLAYGPETDRQVKNISVTMRTPDNDAELAIGFLFTEGIITDKNSIATADHCWIACAENKENVIQVSLKPGIAPSLHNTDRNFYTTSSCGVCGKASINSIRTVSTFADEVDSLALHTDELFTLPEKLRSHQEVFASTGGLHASALFDKNGKILIVREDVGRHNALDKLIGAALQSNLLPLNDHILLLSGRASFELIQKAAMAGIKVVAAIGAPSSLAVNLAEEFGITLIGFLRGKTFNIYSAPHRILITQNEITH